ncbi:hypothetical protein IE985_11615 [Klebsiella pneumoniae]|nr:hypothetical protein [Klebsiella pneumoniae]
MTELQLFAGRLSAALIEHCSLLCSSQKPSPFRRQNGMSGRYWRRCEPKRFQQAMQLIAYLRGVVEHPRMAALVLGKDVQQ